ncbi:conserved hypothetical protein [Culex quinquefasciatus]|uniref:Homeobox domain-containing protein n=1 Tax=Culex quinquefasciatus TaxID=7176 RepID=B0WPJ1_CULQU|nr:conserved hypothetical protein [Culex quinquefasciatus]|eukprot:XP_001850625.1 conserved hypothetical protein [Culex quinquefasciatus]
MITLIWVKSESQSWLTNLGSAYLLPFRKPKRVRTAFSPSQLLKLEHAFENNHYVVGAERKQLAQTLCLTETQGLLDAKRGGKCLSLVSPFAAAAPSPQQEGGLTPLPHLHHRARRFV